MGDNGLLCFFFFSSFSSFLSLVGRVDYYTLVFIGED